MQNFLLVLLLAVAATSVAHADVWKWVDANGKTYFVDTMKPIYTWIDEFGKVHYGDTPDHEDAVRVDLVWHSPGSLDSLTSAEYSPDFGPDSYNCRHATDIYKSYVNAPQLYRTNDAGEREILSPEETANEIAVTREEVRQYCGEDSPQAAELDQAGSSSNR